jgi:tetratricopeptide (TPR) repeat protein
MKVDAADAKVRKQSSKLNFRWLAIGILVVAFLTGGAFLGLRYYPQWREDKLVTRGRELISQKKYAEASLTAQRALQVNGRSVGATQLLIDLGETLHTSDVIPARQRLLELRPELLDNRLRLAEIALEMADASLAGKVLESVPLEARQRARYHELRGRHALLTKVLELAEAEFAEALRIEPTNEAYQLNLAEARLGSNDYGKRTAARREAERLMAKREYFYRASRMLIREALEHQSWSRAVTFAEALEKSPEVLFEDRLLYLSILHHLHHREFVSVLTDIQEAAASNADQVYALLSWLHSNNNVLMAVDWAKRLPREIAFKMPVAMALAQCYSAVENWPALKELLTSSDAAPDAAAGENVEIDWGSSEFVRRALLARCLRAEGDEKNAQVQWNTAVNVAQNRPDALASLARSAITWNWEAESNEVLWMVGRAEENPRWALDILYRRYLAAQSTRNMHQVAVRMYEVAPKEPWVRNNVAFLSLLLETDIERSLKMSEELHREEPENPNYTSTYAYALYVSGDTQKAVEAMKALGPEQLKQPGYAAYLGIMLASTDARDEARAFLVIGKNASLLPEEKKLVERALQKISASVDPDPQRSKIGYLVSFRGERSGTYFSRYTHCA